MLGTTAGWSGWVRSRPGAARPASRRSAAQPVGGEGGGRGGRGAGPVYGGGPAAGPPGRAASASWWSARAVGAEEAGDPAGPDFEAQAVNGGDVPVPLEVVDGAHRGCPFRPGTGASL